MHYFIIINIINENVLFCYCLDKVGVKGLIRWSQGGSVSSELRPNVRDSPGWAGLGKGKGLPQSRAPARHHTLTLPWYLNRPLYEFTLVVTKVP